ncbi:hypothetical protein [Streptomyces griseofuscus]|uniref:Uncharacterized protein n=1 Tax=Streptomyces griseofuscus TaxID=146922 RepID=A0A7H1Q3J3_9ACTN|nr:hypothetical protein [Streptomyces griseofuscus]QNT94873.1 hypothetical protein HEP81_04600 [Streptomyces griseofuscus]
MAEESKEVPEEVTRLREAIAAFALIEDDAACTAAVSEALREWPDLHSELRQLREDRVNALRQKQRKTWPEIAAIIGEVTPERAQQISKGLRGTKRPEAKNPRKKQGTPEPPTE